MDLKELLEDRLIDQVQTIIDRQNSEKGTKIFARNRVYDATKKKRPDLSRR